MRPREFAQIRIDTVVVDYGFDPTQVNPASGSAALVSNTCC